MKTGRMSNVKKIYNLFIYFINSNIYEALDSS